MYLYFVHSERFTGVIEHRYRLVLHEPALHIETEVLMRHRWNRGDGPSSQLAATAQLACAIVADASSGPFCKSGGDVSRENISSLPCRRPF